MDTRWGPVEGLDEVVPAEAWESVDGRVTLCQPLDSQTFETGAADLLVAAGEHLAHQVAVKVEVV